MLGGLRLLCGIDWEVTGREHLPATGAALIAPMHQSAFDTLVWLLLVPDCAYVLKRELTRIPLFGPLLLRAGMIPVDRSGGAAAMRDLIRRAGAAAADGTADPDLPRRHPRRPGRGREAAARRRRAGRPDRAAGHSGRHRFGPFLGPARLPQASRAPSTSPSCRRCPAGLPREALMAQLEQAYADAYAALRRGQAVDNSVGSPCRTLPQQPSGLY